SGRAPPEDRRSRTGYSHPDIDPRVAAHHAAEATTMPGRDTARVAARAGANSLALEVRPRLQEHESQLAGALRRQLALAGALVGHGRGTPEALRGLRDQTMRLLVRGRGRSLLDQAAGGPHAPHRA